MIKLLLTRVGLVVGGLASSLTAGAGVASANPDLGSAVDTTCTYPQFVAALNAQNPQYGSLLDSTPELQTQLQQFLAGSRDQRQQWAQAVVNNRNPTNQQIIPILKTAFDTCNNF
jgi:hemophore-related protein